MVGKNIMDFLEHGLGHMESDRFMESILNKEEILWNKDVAYGKRNAYQVSTKLQKYKDNNEVILTGYDATDQVIKEKSLIQKNRELSIINAIDLELLDFKSLEGFTNQIAEKLVEEFDIELCTFRVATEDGLILKAAKGPLKNEIKEFHIDLDHKAVQDAFDNRAIKRYKGSEVNKINLYGRKDVKGFYRSINDLIYIPIDHDDQIFMIMIIASFSELKDLNLKLLKSVRNHLRLGIEKAKLYDSLRDGFLNTLTALTTAMEQKDTYTEGHSSRVAIISEFIGRLMELSPEQIDNLKFAGILHDIGKLGVEDGIINKEGPLTNEEFDIIKKHPVIGHNILSHLDLGDDVLNGVLLHHKRYDFKGYPEDIEVKKLPLFASIIGVADAMDAMLSKRTYNEERDLDEVMKEIERFSGSQFDPEITSILIDIYQNDRKILENLIKV